MSLQSLFEGSTTTNTITANTFEATNLIGTSLGVATIIADTIDCDVLTVDVNADITDLTTNAIVGASTSYNSYYINDGSKLDMEGGKDFNVEGAPARDIKFTDNLGADILSMAVNTKVATLSGELKVDVINENTDVGVTIEGINLEANAIIDIHSALVTLDTDTQFKIDGFTNPKSALAPLSVELNTTINTLSAVSIIVDDVGGQDDIRGLTILHDVAGASASTRTTGIAYEYDITGTTNAELIGASFSKTGIRDASVEFQAIHVGENIDPILHESGGLVAIEFAWKFDDSGASFTDVTADFNSGGSDVSLWDDDDDIVYLGKDATFGSTCWELDTGASGAGITPVFEYWNGSAWTVIGVTDNTSGMKNSGTVTFSVPGDWATNDVNGEVKFWFRITRTRNSLGTVPIENLVMYASTNTFSWDLDGNLDVNDITLSGDLNVDIVNEFPASGNGVTVDGVLLKDNNVIFATDIGTYQLENSSATVGQQRIQFQASGLAAGTQGFKFAIRNETTGALFKNALSIEDTGNLQACEILKVNVIDELDIGVGTTIEAVLIKDGRATNSSDAAPTTDPELSNKKYVDDQVATVVSVGSGVLARDNGTASDVTGDGTVHQILFPNVVGGPLFNDGDYSVVTSKYTTPSAGKYLVTFQTTLIDIAIADHTSVAVELVGAAQNMITFIPAYDGQYQLNSSHVYNFGSGVDLFANLTVTGTAKTVDINTSKFSVVRLY